eukprot:CAMPEP_0184694016 /NCGR_PEP_ID=MMETSP0313-20130426/2092_1 /TAXON_ID=2792 /ORGANISM="Porphyridium aerugineum, Strain SAG 1380-2" /LENGTH=239 /DNA_ID=CAMNT_0027152225 /DNA_START=53 /DNA_END=772 /DNA_ORIENTATION=+
MCAGNKGDIWIFGYGSLVFKPPTRYSYSVDGYISGCQRRFYQGSIDHRGTPTHPGRVATLIESEPTDIVWGRAFLIESKDVDYITNELDIREANGYSVLHLPVYGCTRRNGSRGGGDESQHEEEDLHYLVTENAITYVANSENKSWLGPPQNVSEEERAIEVMAEHAIQCVGPSGTNVDYILKLDDALNGLISENKSTHACSLCRYEVDDSRMIADLHLHRLAKQIRVLTKMREAADAA